MQTRKTRFSKLSQLVRNNKAYHGSRIETENRYALQLNRGENLDLLVEGVEVDCKHTLGRTWIKPPEAIGLICLPFKTDFDKATALDMG